MAFTCDIVGQYENKSRKHYTSLLNTLAFAIGLSIYLLNAFK